MPSRLLACIICLTAGPVGASNLPGSSPDTSLSSEYSHRIWRVQDGLPENRIRVISQTPDGYLWIGTSGGLVRFDGARFFVFDRTSTPAFRDDSILALCPSKDGSLWIGTEGGGLLHFRNGAFEVLGPAERLTNRFVRALYEDPSGTLWIGTDRGLFRLRDGKIERLDGRDGIPVTGISSIRGDHSGKIWVAAGAGLLLADDSVLHLKLAVGNELKVPTNVHETRDGALWISTAAGLRRMVNGALQEHGTLNNVRATTLCEDDDGNLWIGTIGEGLVRVNSHGVTSYRASAILPGNTILSIFEDREQNLWMGTSDGLLRLSKTLVRTLTSKEGLSSDDVTTVYEGHDHALWIATITGGLFRFKDSKVVPYRVPAPFANVRARVVFEDRDGALWIGTSNDGAIRVPGSKTGGKIVSFTTQNGMRSNTIRQFYQDRHGDVWIGLGSGLSRWDGKTIHTFYIEDGLAYGSVRIITEDHNGDLLVGTDGGVNRIHEGRFVQDQVLALLNSERIWSIHEDSNHALWIGTRGGGLFRIKEGKVGKVTMREGLPSNAVYALVEDAKGNFWMSSPAGVFSAPRAELDRAADGVPGPIAIVPYGVADGMESMQMNGGTGLSASRTVSGDLWFPSVKGAVRFDPNLLRVSSPGPAIIESVIADEKVLPLSGNIDIPPGHGKLEIHYTACSLLSPTRIDFKYMLEGFDETWIEASGHRTAFYTNLPPGQYRFRVVATDRAARGNSSEASLSFGLLPHFYQTRLFYAVCALLAAGCCWAALRIYARQTKARYALLLAERTRLARDMHDTVIQGCVGVSTLLEAAAGVYRTDTSKMIELLDRTRIQIRLTLDEARQAIWDLRHTNFEENVGDTLRDFARQLSAEKGVPIAVATAGSPAALEERMVRAILLVSREAVRNAVTHGSARQIEIRLNLQSEEAYLQVLDDGAGFSITEPAGANGHYGIMGMRERVEQLGGIFSLCSSPGRGTTVAARLPLGARRLLAGRPQPS